MICNEGTLIRLGDLSYDDVEDLARWCEAVNGPGTTRDHAHQAAVVRANMRAEESAERRITRAIYLRNHIGRWVAGGIAAGTRLKMRGCRDGHGIREVESVAKCGHTDGYVLHCRQIFPANPYRRVESKGQYTSHLHDKIAGIYVDGKLIPIAKFLGL